MGNSGAFVEDRMHLLSVSVSLVDSHSPSPLLSSLPLLLPPLSSLSLFLSLLPLHLPNSSILKALPRTSSLFVEMVGGLKIEAHEKVSSSLLCILPHSFFKSFSPE